MESIAAVAGPIGTVLSATGNIAAGNAAARQGQASQNLANYQAAQLEQNAGQQIAAGQGDAEAVLRQSRLLQSRALAVAAASGGGALDPNVLKIIGGIAGEGQLAADTTRFNASETARGMRNQAAATRYSGAQAAAAGQIAERSSRTSALTTMLSGVGGFKNAWDVFGKRAG
jgi:hypothetical protein